jgi:hypothetical protein
MSEWRWFGHAAHFICGQDCRFHLATQIGPWLVSTVGEYLPDSNVREILADSRGIQLQGQGDARRADWMRKVGWESIGYERLYETMVFRAGKPCQSTECGCGLPELASGSELDFEGYNTAGDATRGHYRMCEKWSQKSEKDVEASEHE